MELHGYVFTPAHRPNLPTDDDTHTLSLSLSLDTANHVLLRTPSNVNLLHPAHSASVVTGPHEPLQSRPSSRVPDPDPDPADIIQPTCSLSHPPPPPPPHRPNHPVVFYTPTSLHTYIPLSYYPNPIHPTWLSPINGPAPTMIART
jgi:hypothetical protein